MDKRERAVVRHQQARWLRPDGYRWLRHDAAKFFKPGTEPANIYPALARSPSLIAQDRRIAEAVAHEKNIIADLQIELASIKAEITRRREERKYSASQPRVPAGSGRESGRWSDGSSSASRPRVYIDTTDLDNGGIGEADGGDPATGPSANAFDIGDVSSETGSLGLFDITPRDTRIDGVRLAGDPPGSGSRATPSAAHPETDAGNDGRAHGLCPGRGEVAAARRPGIRRWPTFL